MKPFWKEKSLSQMTPNEWESLCDGCGRCCIQKLQDDETNEVLYTRVSCRLLHTRTCRCLNYPNRKRLVPDCVLLTPESVEQYQWLPSSCAYRRLAEGKDLAWWHPLVSGNPRTVHESGISVQDKVISENYVHPDDWENHAWEDHEMDWNDGL